jgi:hypothetical protein
MPKKNLDKQSKEDEEKADYLLVDSRGEKDGRWGRLGKEEGVSCL